MPALPQSSKNYKKINKNIKKLQKHLKAQKTTKTSTQRKKRKEEMRTRTLKTETVVNIWISMDFQSPTFPPQLIASSSPYHGNCTILYLSAVSPSQSAKPLSNLSPWTLWNPFFISNKFLYILQRSFFLPLNSHKHSVLFLTIYKRLKFLFHTTFLKLGERIFKNSF